MDRVSGVRLENNFGYFIFRDCESFRTLGKDHSKVMWRMSLWDINRCKMALESLVPYTGEDWNHWKRTGIGGWREDGLKKCFGTKGTNRISQDLCSSDDLWPQ